MRLFETHPLIVELSEELSMVRAHEKALELQITLAWYLRQADPVRSASLSQSVRQSLALLPPSSDPHDPWMGRLHLIEAEAQWLASNFAQARTAADAAMHVFTRAGDATGLADTYFIVSFIESSLGRLAERDAALQHAVDQAQQAADTERIDTLQAHQARYAALRDVRRCNEVWAGRFEEGVHGLHPATSTSVFTFFATRDFNSGQFGRSLEHLDKAFEAAQLTGQQLTATVVAVNAGNAYLVLNDHDASLAWLQKGLEIARTTRWPSALGPCLRQMGETLRGMGRLDEAQLAVEEAIEVYAPLRGSRNFAAVLSAMGDICFDRGEFAQALGYYRQHAERAIALGQRDMEIDSHIGIANALLQLGNGAEAETEGLYALNLAHNQGATASQMNALRLLARIHATRGDTPLALARLEQAMETAQSIAGYLIPGELLFELASQYARAGRMEEAYAMAIRANAARESVLTIEASNRATAIQTRLETERVRAETEHHRRQAESESKRATLLQQTSDTLELLGTIGQEITSQLDQEHVFEAIEKHVHGLLDAPTFAIYLMDADGHGMTSVYDIEQGKRLPGDHVNLASESSFTARCVRERRELLISESDESLEAALIPGTLLTRSALFAPLTIGDRVLGVMTIQSPRQHAYAENERLIFRTLCAYAAIALDNSVAYTHLRDAKDQLVAQEKLAALGALVAGVAHELNTPIGNSLLTISALQQRTLDLEQAAASGTMRRSTLSDYIAAAREGADIITRGLETAAELVQSFKQVAVDQATEQRRNFELLRTSQDVVATLYRSINKAGHHLEMDIAASIQLDGYPGPYGQVLTNFINNALLHAFEGRRGGTMRLSAKLLRNAQVEIQFSDDGLGIAPEHLNRIFEPFFTTKMGRGGSGLGMSISYNIVQSLFGGELTVDSVLGEGTCFTLRIPLVAPQPVQPLSSRS